MYTKNLSASTTYRTYFEMLNDGTFISQVTSGTNRIKIQGASPNDNQLYILYNARLQALQNDGNATFVNINGTVIGSTSINIQTEKTYAIQTDNTVTI
jgi:hypothetical protein